MNKKKLFVWIKWLWFAAVIIAAAFYFQRNFKELLQHLHSLSWKSLALSLAFLIAGKIMIINLTRISLQDSGWDPGYNQVFYINSVSQLGKYLPGAIWHFVGRYGMYRAKELKNTQAGQAMILENAWLISSAFIVGLVLSIPFLPTALNQHFAWLNDGLQVIILILLPIVWFFSLWLINRILHFHPKNSIRIYLSIIATSIMGWILIGASFYTLLPKGTTDLLRLALGGFAFSWAIGFITIFAPGGIGVRETILASLLALQFSPTEAIFYATIHRLIWVLCEILLALFAEIFLRKTFLGAQEKIPVDVSSAGDSGNEELLDILKKQANQRE